MSRGEVTTRAVTDVDTTSHDGHAAAFPASPPHEHMGPVGEPLDARDPYSWQPEQ
jgi:hypothetical protein